MVSDSKEAVLAAFFSGLPSRPLPLLLSRSIPPPFNPAFVVILDAQACGFYSIYRVCMPCVRLTAAGHRYRVKSFVFFFF